MMKIILILTITLAVCCAEKFSFEGYHLVRIYPNTQAQLKLIEILQSNNDIDIWNSEKGNPNTIDILLSPVAFFNYKTIFKSSKIKYDIIDSNIQRKFDEQEKSMVRSKQDKSIIGKYARYSEIINYINTIVEDNSDIASNYTTGTTYENRELRVLVLKTATSQKGIWIDCGIHAREWVSPSTCIWFVDRIIKDFRNNDPVAVALLAKYEIHILPLVNPDGYEYTWTTYRLWRKNRTPNAGSSCEGTDLNRNYPFQWMVVGASKDPCSETYGGVSAGSELETKAVQKAINANLGKWESFISLHSYGKFWLIPYSYTYTMPTDYFDIEKVAVTGSNALKSVYGTVYTMGSASAVLYLASGVSFDWAKAVCGIKYSIGMELRPGQTGTDWSYGFALPEGAPPTGEETYIGLKAMLNHIRTLSN